MSAGAKQSNSSLGLSLCPSKQTDVAALLVLYLGRYRLFIGFRGYILCSFPKCHFCPLSLKFRSFLIGRRPFLVPMIILEQGKLHSDEYGESNNATVHPWFLRVNQGAHPENSKQKTTVYFPRIRKKCMMNRNGADLTLS